MNPRAKHRAKYVASLLGLRMRDTLPRRQSASEFYAYLAKRGFTPRTVIDVGVADGTFEIYDAFPKATYLLIEPMEEFLPALQWISSNYDAQYVLAAAGSENRTATIFFDDGIAEMHGASLISASEGKNRNSRDVSIRRLDSIVQEKKLSGPYLLKIDTQGTELEVLSGANAILAETEVIVLETSFFKFLGRDEPLFNEVIHFMEGLGFSPYDFFGGLNRPLDGALGQIDVAFVKIDGLFRSDHRFSSDSSGKVGIIRRALGAMRRRMGV
jgi:FkbM family methyltransferase